MRNVRLNPEAITNLAAAQGIESVSELARQAGYEQSYFRRVLTEERPALPTHVHALAKVLGVKPSLLLHPSEAEFGEMMDAAAESGSVAS